MYVFSGSARNRADTAISSVVPGRTERNMVEHLLHARVKRSVLAVKQLFGSLRERRAGRDPVDQNSGRPQLERHDFGQIDDGRLGRHKRALQPQRDEAGDRGDVDNPARALLLHDLSGRPTDFEYAVEVDIEHAVPFVAARTDRS